MEEEWSPEVYYNGDTYKLVDISVRQGLISDLIRTDPSRRVFIKKGDKTIGVQLSELKPV